MTANQLNDIFTAAQSMMSPYDLNANGAVIVSSINTITTAAGPKITWQRRYGSLSAADAPGKLGAASATPSAALPIDLRPALNEEVLTVEVYFTFTPIFRSYIYNGSTLYLVAYTRPRNHNLTTPPPAS